MRSGGTCFGLHAGFRVQRVEQLVRRALNGDNDSPFRTFNKEYMNYGSYFFLRWHILRDEFERRGFTYAGIGIHVIPAGIAESPFEVPNTERDISTYVGLIEEGNFVEEFDRLSELNLRSPEDIFSENEFLTSAYKDKLLDGELS